MSNLKLWLSAGVVVLVVAYAGETYIQAQTEIKTFDECVAAGNAVLKSYPAQCVTRAGKVFVQNPPLRQGNTPAGRPAPHGDRLCDDKCGDGRCQEIVCLGTGCPCAENAQSCPQDCKR